MGARIFRHFFPQKFAYALVDSEGKFWSLPRRLTAHRAETLNRLISSWNGSDLRWRKV